jgi:hypothetical protein
MKYGYARVSTDGQSVAAQVAALNAAGAGKVFREVASGAKTDRSQLRRAIATLGAGDLLIVPGWTGSSAQPAICSIHSPPSPTRRQGLSAPSANTFVRERGSWRECRRLFANVRCCQ